jgi:recombination protein RecA
MSAFLSKQRKEEKKLVEQGVAIGAPPPLWWIHTGNYLLNKIISGKYLNGFAQGRIGCLAGPSSAGKSFIVGNLVREAQKMGLGVVVFDSEGAMDNEFMEKIGVDTSREDYLYRGISTIAQAVKYLSGFVKDYRESGETQGFLIILDSIDMLQTSSQEENYDSGIQKGDQGQHAKQIKAMLASLVHDIKSVNMAMVCCKQVYQNQDPMAAKNPQTAWLMTESTKFAMSQVLLVTKFMLKDESAKKIPGKSDTQYSGFRLKAYGMKTRFTKPFSSVSVQVPYDTGMDPFDGMLQVAVATGVVEQTGAWYAFGDQKFQSKNFDDHKEAILAALVAKEDEVYLEDEQEGDIIDATQSGNSKPRNQKIVTESAND